MLEHTWKYNYILLTFTSLFVRNSAGQDPVTENIDFNPYYHRLQYSDNNIPDTYHHHRQLALSSSSTRHSQIPLYPDNRCQHVFTIHTNDTTFGFEIFKDVMTADIFDYKINVVVEKLTWTKQYPQNRDFHERMHLFPSILIEGITSKNQLKSVRYGYEVNNILNHFQTVQELMDDVTSVNVSAGGDWTDFTVTAQLVASIYYDVPEGCDNCREGYFCCGSGSCSSNHSPPGGRRNEMYRCIPVSDQSSWIQSSGTICSNHPNCGFYCNLDESPENCSNGYNGDSCFGGDCHLANVALRIAVLVIFCFLLPPIVILFLCRFNTFRSACDRARSRILSRGHRNSEVSIADAVEPTVATITSQNERRRAHSYNAEDDPPPSYEEYLQHFKETESPAYNEVVPDPMTLTAPVISPVPMARTPNRPIRPLCPVRSLPRLNHPEIGAPPRQTSRRSSQDGAHRNVRPAAPEVPIQEIHNSTANVITTSSVPQGGVANLAFVLDEAADNPPQGPR